VAKIKRLCLNMIVKNEMANIERCLRSVADHIDCWVIGDTGSTDGTQDLVKNFFADRGIPGELRAFPFYNFGQARNAALDHAYALSLQYDYLLFSDADMELAVNDANFKQKLVAPGYRVLQRNSGGLAYWNTRLVRRDAGARYHGVTHEYIDFPGTVEELTGVSYIDHASASNRVDKFEQDIRLLKSALEREPENSRYWFYLAQSYRDAGRLAEAAEAYAKRAEMGGLEEEAWMARLQQARCLRGLDDEGGFIATALTAFDQCPQRAEPLYDLARYYREKGRNHAAVTFAEFGLTLPRPKQGIIENYVYDAGLREEFSIVANYAPDQARKQRGFDVCNSLALDSTIGDSPRELAWSNLFFYLKPATAEFPSFSARAINFAPPEGFAPLNPSVSRAGEELFVSQRSVNCKMTEDGQYHTIDGQPIITRNFLLQLNEDLSVRNTSEILPPKNMPTPLYSQVLGFEDLRLIFWRGSWWGISCVREMTPEGWCEQVLTRLERESEGSYRHSDLRRLEPEGPKVHEKNWMPQVEGDALRFVHLCDPTKILDYEARIVRQGTPNIAARNFRGGSQLIPFDDGWLALIHEVQWRAAERRRYHFHRFVWFDASLEIKRVGRPFYFIRKGVEFAAGLCWHPDQLRLVVSFSTSDSESWLASIAAEEILSCLESTETLGNGQICASSINKPELTIEDVVEFTVKNQPIKFVVSNASDAIMKFYKEKQFYETEELEIIARHYTGAGTFIDIGANVGNHAIYISKFTSAPKIIVFEPNDVALSLLRKNCSLNNCQNVDMRYLGVALGAKAGRYRKETPDLQNLGYTRLFADPQGGVEAITGDSVLGEESVEFIKLDVEGMEFEVLEGLRQTIRRCRPKMFLEIWDFAEPAFRCWCEQEGYQVADQHQRYEGIQNYLVEPIESE
jgi:FkbM family methyltransferase